MAKTKSYFTHNTSLTASDRDLITSTTNYNGQLKRYFSSLDAEIFIGGERILDIVRLDFSYEEKKMPFYGFNSFWPSRVFAGQKIIQGSFVINFTEPGYIAKLLQKIESSDLEQKTELVGKSCSAENAPLFAKSFDILVGYGGYTIDKESSFKNTYQILQGVHINGYQQILDISGEPVLEVYSFLAKNLKFEGYEYEEIDTGSSEDKDANDSGTANIGGYEIVEKRLNPEVAEVESKCQKDKKLLGIIVDTYHSLHKTNKQSHVYVEFNHPFINAGKEDKVVEGVTLTIHDNEIDLSETFHLMIKNGTQYGILMDESKTKILSTKLNKKSQSQPLISCTIEFTFTRNGEKNKAKKQVFMRRGDNY